MVTDRAARQFDALGDGSRRALVELLVAGPAPVGELAALLPISRPAVSQHLRVLEEAGLVRHRRAGTRHLYELDRRGADAVRAYLDRYWSRSLAAFAEAVIEDHLVRPDDRPSTTPKDPTDPTDPPNPSDHRKDHHP